MAFLLRVSPRILLGLALACFLIGSRQWEVSSSAAWAWGVMGFSLAGIAWVGSTREIDGPPLS